ncbi:MAG: hypothetical protein GIX03_04640 [Candidatus Eremiobacteraeota bacterium]|nr:hypothetical protein [Candidatus Eremiobacteraeota bacterium]MBC5802286.1 hypothetical protein [Candidatus Eremiobacteraeota bacterium]
MRERSARRPPVVPESEYSKGRCYCQARQPFEQTDQRECEGRHDREEKRIAESVRRLPTLSSVENFGAVPQKSKPRHGSKRCADAGRY